MPDYMPGFGNSFENKAFPGARPVGRNSPLAFMFETRFRQRVTAWTENLDNRQDNYIHCWSGLKRHFNPKWREPK